MPRINDESGFYSDYAVKQAGLSNKFYSVEAIRLPDGNGQWQFRWGRIGTSGTTKVGVERSFHTAAQKCAIQMDRKLEGGYKRVTPIEAIAIACDDHVERAKSDDRAISFEVPVFGAGVSESRCQAFARKYLDKANLLCVTGDELNCDEYFEQAFRLVDQCRREWIRLLESPKHSAAIRSSEQAKLAFESVMRAIRGHCLGYRDQIHRR